MQSRTLLFAGSGLLALGTIGWSFYSSNLVNGGVTGSVSSEVPPAAAANAVVALPPPDLLRPLTPEEAAKENAERPFAERPDSPAHKFVLGTADNDGARALNCLAQAVYYEAASEGVDGGRAVAQIVLNRMRHPGYPASVCGVVYQGAERSTGCQFTFTCDGSLLRQPAAYLWARSRKIAQEALAGRVFAPVGHATHYHADYVMPYWADSLDKSAQIGRHIFYRLRGIFGEDRAFSQRYSGREPAPPPKKEEALVLPPNALTEELASALINDDVTNKVREVEKASQAATSPLLADADTSILLVGGSPVAAPSGKAKRRSSECPPRNDEEQIKPLSPNDLRAATAASGC